MLPEHSELPSHGYLSVTLIIGFLLLELFCHSSYAVIRSPIAMSRLPIRYFSGRCFSFSFPERLLRPVCTPDGFCFSESLPVKPCSSFVVKSVCVHFSLLSICPALPVVRFPGRCAQLPVRQFRPGNKKAVNLNKFFHL